MADAHLDPRPVEGAHGLRELGVCDLGSFQRRSDADAPEVGGADRGGRIGPVCRERHGVTMELSQRRAGQVGGGCDVLPHVVE